MKLLQRIKLFTKKGYAWVGARSLLAKILISLVLLGVIWFAIVKIKSPSDAPHYQTSVVEKKTLVVSVSGSGQVASVNSAQATTQASGVVKKLYVKDTDIVISGQPIVELDLDIIGKQRYQQALSSYQSAQNSLESAKAALFTSQSDMLTKWKSYYDIATNETYQNSDGSPNASNREHVAFMTTQDDWLASEAKYKIQQAAINQAQTSLTSSWYSLEQASPTIYAPISGKISGMSLQIGNVITASSNSTSGSATSVKIANIETKGMPAITISLSEIDVPKVTIGNKATVTLDALTDKSYTGSVVSIDTVGSVSSGVTVYPVTIQLDVQSPEILPNMSASANIITQTKDNVIAVPASALVTSNGSTMVRLMKNGKLTEVPVETGIASDTEIEIVSGVAEGDTLVTSVIQPTTATRSTQNSSQSPFGIFGNTNRSGGGAQFQRIVR